MLDDLRTLGAGLLLGLSLAAPPGPVNALMATEARRGWWRAARIGLGATTGDALYLLVFALGLGGLLSRSPIVRAVLAVAGGLIMLWFAWGALEAARAPAPPSAATGRADDRRGAPGPGFLAGLTIVLTSPYNVVWWTTVGGELLRQLGWLVVIGLFSAILAWLAFFPWAVRAGESRFRGFARVVDVLSAAVLAGYGVYFIAGGIGLA